MKNFFLVLSLFVSINCHSQNSDPCGCDAVLLGGTLHKIYSQRNQNSTFYAKQYIVHTDYSEFKKQTTSGGGVGVLEILSLNGNMSEQEYNQKKAEYLQESQQYRQDINSDLLIESFGDKTIINAWAGCKRDCVMEELSYYFELSDSSNINFEIKYLARSQIKKITSSIIENGKVIDRHDNKLVDNNTLLVPGNSAFRIKRQSKKNPVRITVKIAGDDKIKVIPVYKEAVPPWPPDTLPKPIKICSNEWKTFSQNESFRVVSGLKVTVPKSGKYVVNAIAGIQLPEGGYEAVAGIVWANGETGDQLFGQCLCNKENSYKCTFDQTIQLTKGDQLELRFYTSKNTPSYKILGPNNNSCLSITFIE